MRMHNGVDIGTRGVNRHVHAHLRGACAISGDAVALVVANQEILGVHGSLANTRGGGQDAILIQARGDVAVVGRDPAALVHHLSGVDDFFAELLLTGKHDLLIPSSVPGSRRPRSGTGEAAFAYRTCAPRGPLQLWSGNPPDVPQLPGLYHQGR